MKSSDGDWSRICSADAIVVDIGLQPPPKKSNDQISTRVIVLRIPQDSPVLGPVNRM